VASAKVLNTYFGETLIANIKPEQVHTFIMSRKEQGKAAATINGEMAHLAHMFAWAGKLKLATNQPCPCSPSRCH
jgi:site-specific recombinase XerD